MVIDIGLTGRRPAATALNHATREAARGYADQRRRCPGGEREADDRDGTRGGGAGSALLAIAEPAYDQC